MSNYPDGSENDPNSPWNKRDQDVECEECSGDGFIHIEDYDEIMTENTCPTCEGCGTVLSNQEEYHKFRRF